MLEVKHKKAITSVTHKKYTKATKRQKSKILDEFINFTGYSRTYAARILRLAPGKVVGYSKQGGKNIKYVIGRKKKKRKRERIYGHDVFLALKKIWTIFDFIRGKRLAPLWEKR